MHSTDDKASSKEFHIYTNHYAPNPGNKLIFNKKI